MEMLNTTFKNCTPHALNIKVNDEGPDLILEPSGILPRVDEKLDASVVGTIQGVGLRLLPIEADNKEVINLPDAEEGVTFVVSRMVYDAVTWRHDLACPGPLVRNDAGVIIGCDGVYVKPSHPMVNDNLAKRVLHLQAEIEASDDISLWKVACDNRAFCKS